MKSVGPVQFKATAAGDYKLVAGEGMKQNTTVRLMLTFLEKKLNPIAKKHKANIELYHSSRKGIYISDNNLTYAILVEMEKVLKKGGWHPIMIQGGIAIPDDD